MMPDDYLWFSLSLRISGHGLDLDEVTHSLGLVATHSVKEGEILRPGRDVRADRDVLVYDIARKWDRSINDLLQIAEATLMSKSGILERLAQEHEVVLWCSYQTNLAQGGFELAPSALAFLHALGIPFTVSVLSWGEAKD